MRIVDTRDREVEIAPQHWSLAEDLFLSWGHKVDGNVISVIDVDDITPELSAWGVPWKWI